MKLEPYPLYGHFAYRGSFPDCVAMAKSYGLTMVPVGNDVGVWSLETKEGERAGRIIADPDGRSTVAISDKLQKDTE